MCIRDRSAADLKVKEFMRTGVYTVEQTRGINECISKMQRHNVDTLIVVDSLKTVSYTHLDVYKRQPPPSK